MGGGVFLYLSSRGASWRWPHVALALGGVSEHGGSRSGRLSNPLDALGKAIDPVSVAFACYDESLLEDVDGRAATHGAAFGTVASGICLAGSCGLGSVGCLAVGVGAGSDVLADGQLYAVSDDAVERGRTPVGLEVDTD